MMDGSPRRSRSRARRSFSRSRSRSPRGSRKTFRRGYKSRSRSRGRSHSRSPVSGRRHHGGNRVSPPSFHGSARPHARNDNYSRSSRLLQDAPGPNKCLGVFGLSLRTTERDLREVFSRYGPIEECTVVIDAQTGRSRGFAFIYYESIEDAKAAKESCNGIEIDNRRIRVDFSITQRAHTPTPGIYMGKPTYRRNNYDRKYDGGGGGGRFRERREDYRYRRSPSPYRHSGRRRHSRSRSFSRF